MGEILEHSALAELFGLKIPDGPADDDAIWQRIKCRACGGIGTVTYGKSAKRRKCFGCSGDGCRLKVRQRVQCRTCGHWSVVDVPTIRTSRLRCKRCGTVRVMDP